MAGILGTNTLCQVAFVVKDIDATKEKYAKFFGCEVPPNILADKKPETIVNGKPAPDAACLLAFFEVGNGVTIELIQPNGVSSVWQDVLDEKGEGFHHIAFNGGLDLAGKLAACEENGYKCVQTDGGYAYVDALADLKTLIEFF